MDTQKLYTLYQQKLYTDLTLILINGNDQLSVRVHKIILHTNSINKSTDEVTLNYNQTTEEINIEININIRYHKSKLNYKLLRLKFNEIDILRKKIDFIYHKLTDV